MRILILEIMEHYTINVIMKEGGARSIARAKNFSHAPHLGVPEDNVLVAIYVKHELKQNGWNFSYCIVYKLTLHS